MKTTVSKHWHWGLQITCTNSVCQLKEYKESQRGSCRLREYSHVLSRFAFGHFIFGCSIILRDVRCVHFCAAQGMNGKFRGTIVPPATSKECWVSSCCCVPCQQGFGAGEILLTRNTTTPNLQNVVVPVVKTCWKCSKTDVWQAILILDNFGRSLLVTCFVSRFWFVGQMCPSCPWVSCKKKQERFLYFRYFSLGWEVSLVVRIAVKPLVGLNTLLPGVDSVMTSSKWFSFNVMTWWAKGEEMTSSSKP